VRSAIRIGFVVLSVALAVVVFALTRTLQAQAVDVHLPVLPPASSSSASAAVGTVLATATGGQLNLLQPGAPAQPAVVPGAAAPAPPSAAPVAARVVQGPAATAGSTPASVLPVVAHAVQPALPAPAPRQAAQSIPTVPALAGTGGVVAPLLGIAGRVADAVPVAPVLSPVVRVVVVGAPALVRAVADVVSCVPGAPLLSAAVRAVTGVASPLLSTVGGAVRSVVAVAGVPGVLKAVASDGSTVAAEPPGQNAPSPAPPGVGVRSPTAGLTAAGESVAAARPARSDLAGGRRGGGLPLPMPLAPNAIWNTAGTGSSAAGSGGSTAGCLATGWLAAASARRWRSSPLTRPSGIAVSLLDRPG
jgi:hypothetical protein